VVVFIFNACEQSNAVLSESAKNGFLLENKNDSLSYVVLRTDSLTDKWELPYPVYQFQVGDIDEDGIEDVIVGVVKSTRFDSSLANRIFIFKNYQGYIRPMWMGSKLSKPLIDFRFCNTVKGSFIRSVEKEKENKYLVAEYKWRKFGLEFVQYVERETTLENAKNELLK
jgi:hypothetical protein